MVTPPHTLLEKWIEFGMERMSLLRSPTVGLTRLQQRVLRLDDTSLNPKVGAIKAAMCMLEEDGVIFAEHNATIHHLNRLLINSKLHLKPSGLKHIADNWSLVLRTGVPLETKVRQCMESNQKSPSHKATQLKGNQC